MVENAFITPLSMYVPIAAWSLLQNVSIVTCHVLSGASPTPQVPESPDTLNKKKNAFVIFHERATLRITNSEIET